MQIALQHTFKTFETHQQVRHKERGVGVGDKHDKVLDVAKGWSVGRAGWQSVQVSCRAWRMQRRVRRNQASTRENEPTVRSIGMSPPFVGLADTRTRDVRLVKRTAATTLMAVCSSDPRVPSSSYPPLTNQAPVVPHRLADTPQLWNHRTRTHPAGPTAPHRIRSTTSSSYKQWRNARQPLVWRERLFKSAKA
jgi:hypothetical protein